MDTPLIEAIKAEIRQEIKTLTDAIEILRYCEGSSDVIKYLESLTSRMSKRIEYNILNQ